MTKTNRKNENSRNSSIELLRVLCIFGILLMHTFGPYYGWAKGSNLMYGLFVNTLFNSGVSIFFLISGYYGIKYSKTKIIRFWLLLVFYSFIELGVQSYFNHQVISFDIIIQSLLPITYNKYWFMTSYIVILLFSKYINSVTEKIEKKEFKKNIIILLLIFSILPTFTKFQFLRDSGKGIINMIIIYIIGRYIKKYEIKLSTLKSVLLFLIPFSIEFILNYNATSANGFNGVVAPYACDYSIFIIAIAISIFMIFKNIKFYNNFINFIAADVLIVYLIDPIIRFIVPYYKDVNAWGETSRLPFVLLIYSSFIFFIGILFGKISKLLLGKIEKTISNKIIILEDKLDNII